jgi:integrase
MPRRALAEMELWEQRLKNITKRWAGWSVRENKGRVLVAHRPKAGMSEQVLLPTELRWAEQCEDDITEWVKRIYKHWDGGEKSLKVALEAAKPESNKLGDTYAVTWEDIREGYRVRCMDHGRKIALKTWEKNYLPTINEALDVLAAGKATDGPTLLRETAKKWADKYTMRANCVAVLKGFLKFAVMDSRFNAPNSWLIDEFHAQPIRGEKNAEDYLETAALEDAEILELLDAVEKRWGEGWRNVISALVAFGLRPGEVEQIELRTNSEGLPQMYCTNRKSGGKVKTEPRWLEEVPLTAADGTKVELNVTDRWATMAWPQTRDGGRRVVSAHYIEQYLSKVSLWQQLRLEYAEEMNLAVKPYSFRNSWNTRAKALGIPDAIVSRAFGNTVATNTRSYRQSTDAKARAAFRDALGR